MNQCISPSVKLKLLCTNKAHCQHIIIKIISAVMLQPHLQLPQTALLSFTMLLIIDRGPKIRVKIALRIAKAQNLVQLKLIHIEKFSS